MRDERIVDQINWIRAWMGVIFFSILFIGYVWSLG